MTLKIATARAVRLLSMAMLALSLPLSAQAKDKRTYSDPTISLKAATYQSLGQTYDCYQKSNKMGGLIGKLQSKLTEKRQMKYAVRAAREAMGLGYNYAVMTPLQAMSKSKTNSRTGWEVVGVGYGYGGVGILSAPVTRSFTSNYRTLFLGCTAVDDVDAFRIMWDTHQGYHAKPGEALIDLRKLVTTFGPEVEGSDYTPPPPEQPLISAKHFVRPGDKERIVQTLDVMRAAADCRDAHVAVTPERIALPQTASQERAMRACMEPLRTAAREAEWHTFPLFVDDVAASTEARGYVVKANSSLGGSERPVPVADLRSDWGEGWETPSVDLPGFDGLALFRGLRDDRARNDLMLASDTLSNAELLDIGVFLFAKEHMKTRENGVGIDDRTDGARKDFDRKDARLRERAVEHARQRADMEREMAEARAAYEASRRANPQMPSWDVMMADSGDPFAMHAEDAPTLGRPSDDETYEPTRGQYRAFETYRNVLILNGTSATKCYDWYDVCADNLQAYNAIGPKVVGPAFQPLDTPMGYEPFVTSR